MFRRTSVRVSASVLLSLLTALAAAQPRGYGIVAKINDHTDGTEIANAKEPQNAHITAIQSSFNWSDLEPQDDQFDFSSIGNWFDTIYPKRGVLVIMPISGKNPDKPEHALNEATPSWLIERLSLESPSGIVSYTNSTASVLVHYPLFWNQTYQDEFEELLNHLAEYLTLAPVPPNNFPSRIDQIEYIRVTGYGVETTEPSFYNTTTLALKPALQAAGITFVGIKPRLHWKTSYCPIGDSGCRKYSQATTAFWDMWIAIFPNVPLAVTVRFNEDTTSPNYNYYQGYKNNIDNNFGLGSTTDVILNTAWQTKSCEMQTLRTNLAALQTANLKVGFGDVHCTFPIPTTDDKCCMQYDLAREGIGLTGSGGYSPRSLASYLTLGSNRWGLPAGSVMWTWADGQLASYTGTGPDTCASTCEYVLDCGNPNDDCTSMEENNERDDGVD